MKFKKRRWYLFFLLLFACIFLGHCALEQVAPYMIISPYRVQLDAQQTRLSAGYLPEQYGLNAQKLLIQTQDNFQLSNYFCKTTQDSPKGIIVMLHGIGGCKEDYLGVAKRLNDLGFHCMLYDARAHGQSEGKYCTYGALEKYDLTAVVSAIKEQAPLLKVGVWASSMGAAVALQGLAVEPRIDFGIIESTFTDLSQVVSDYQTRYCLGIRLRSVTNRALERAGEIAGFNPFAVQPLEVCKQIQQPVLVVHGDEDQRISFECGEQLYQALASPQKAFYRVAGGGHVNLFEIGGEPYWNRILAFIYKHSH